MQHKACHALPWKDTQSETTTRTTNNSSVTESDPWQRGDATLQKPWEIGPATLHLQSYFQTLAKVFSLPWLLRLCRNLGLKDAAIPVWCSGAPSATTFTLQKWCLPGRLRFEPHHPKDVVLCGEAHFLVPRPSGTFAHLQYVPSCSSTWSSASGSASPNVVFLLVTRVIMGLLLRNPGYCQPTTILLARVKVPSTRNVHERTVSVYPVHHTFVVASPHRQVGFICHTLSSGRASMYKVHRPLLLSPCAPLSCDPLRISALHHVLKTVTVCITSRLLPPAFTMHSARTV